MSTDSTELTFVRCPSCRSLVPAVSTRCRMCGATLDSSQAKSDDSEKKSSRVRQRTMSQPDNQLSETAGKVREDMGESATTPPPVSAMESSPPIGATNAAPQVELEPSEDDDPLSAYIEEVEIGESPAPKMETPKPAPAMPAPAQGQNMAAAAPGPAIVAKSETKPMNEVQTPDPGPNGHDSARVIVESGNRRQGGRPGLSFGKPRDEVREEPKRSEEKRSDDRRNDERRGDERRSEERRSEDRRTEDRRHEERPRHEHRHQDHQQQARPGGSQGRAEQRSGREDQRSHRPTDERQGHERQDRNQQRQPRQDQQRSHEQPQRSQEQPRLQDPRPSEGKRPDAGASRLFGWLVSYADKSGTAVELREGKFFVSNSSLKENDMIVADSSISTPHALVAIHLSDGMLVQDLMSERGVFVRRRSNEAYQRVYESVRLEHGDWVRFGDVEYLVCVVAHAGGK